MAQQDMYRGPKIWPFSGIPSFLRSKIVTDLDQLEADIAVMGAPTDEGSPFMGGARFAPQSIRQHSLRFGQEGYYNFSEDKEYLEYEMKNGRIADVGDAPIIPTNAEDSFYNITAMTKKVLEKGAMPVVLGGDHAVSFPVVRAFEEEPLYVFHFDAHIDYSPFMHGFEYTNGHAFRHINAMANVDTIYQVGIRSLRNVKENVDDSFRDGNRIVSMEEFRDVGQKNLVEELPSDAKVYVSIDIDVLDMSLVPGCVSAEPNGMHYQELEKTLKVIAEHTDVVGFDLCEVNPQLDVGTGVTSYLAAHTVMEFLGDICDQPRWVARRETR